MKTRVQVKYRKAKVELTRFCTHDEVYTGRCKACGQEGRTELHHYLYAYTTAQVRSDPRLALDNTIELCYQCHRLADALRKLLSDTVRSRAVIRAIDSKTREDANAKQNVK